MAKGSPGCTNKVVFVVQGSTTPTVPLWLILFVAILSAAVSVALESIEPETMQRNPMWLYISCFILLTSISFRSRTQSLESTLTLYPVGVQTSSGTLIPRQDIVDVVVHEIVLSYKVFSVVLLRVSASPITVDRTIYDLLSQNKVQLIRAFPGVELSYLDCIEMRNKISRALGLD